MFCSDFARNAAAEGSLSARFLLVKGSRCRHVLVYGRSGALMRFRPGLAVKWDGFRCETTALKRDSTSIFEQRRAGSETSHLSAYLRLFLHLQLPELNTYIYFSFSSTLSLPFLSFFSAFLPPPPPPPPPLHLLVSPPSEWLFEVGAQVGGERLRVNTTQTHTH